MTDAINISFEYDKIVDIINEYDSDALDNKLQILNNVWYGTDKIRDDIRVNAAYTEDKTKTTKIYSINSCNIDFKSLLYNIQNNAVTSSNFEYIFCLNNLISFEFPSGSKDIIKTICYTDNDGMTLAALHINQLTKKIYIQAFAAIFPRHGFMPPNKVHSKILAKARLLNWSTEDGGINYFDGNIETRYKDDNNKVMAAVISKPDGEIDTIVEYQYKDNKKIQMEHTNQFGYTKTIYDTSSNSATLVFDVDTTGNIYGITTQFASSDSVSNV